MPEPLRERWLHILTCLLLLVGLSPHPSPQPIVSMIEATKISLQAGRQESALLSIEEALFFEPALHNLHLFAAELAINAGQVSQATEHLAVIRTQSENTLEYLCLQSQIQLILGQLSEAETVWATTEGRCPNREHFLKQLAQIYLTQDQPQQAKPVLEKLFHLKDLDPQTLRSYALVAATTDPGQSLQNLKSIDDQIGDAYPILPTLIQTIEEAQFAQDPSYTLARVGQTLARNSEWHAAVWAFQNALDLNPEYIEAEAYLGLAIDRNGGDGYQHLQNASFAAESAPLPHIFLALHWQMQGDFEQARQELELAAQLDPSNPVVAAELGTAFAAIGDIPAAISAYQLATELAPDKPDFWLLLAQFSVFQEIEVEALGLPAARNALVLDLTFASALDALAYGHFLAGDVHLAERFISRAIQLQPRHALTQYHLGMIFEALGNIEGATRAFEFVLMLDKNGAVADLAERALSRIRP